MPRIASLNATLLEIPLWQPFATSQDAQARTASRAVIIRLTLDDGQIFVGESAPVGYVTGESQQSVLSAVSVVAPLLAGADITRLRPLVEIVHNAAPASPSAWAGIESALYQAFAAVSGLSLWNLWGGATTEVETDMTLSIVPDMVDRAIEASQRGFRRFKMKLGSPDPATDLQRLLNCHRAIPNALFRLDANQAFTASQALDFVDRALDGGVRIELLEQPVLKEDLAALDAVAQKSPVPVFADEAVQAPADAVRLVRETCVHGINIKLMKSGLSGALDIIAIAKAAKLNLMLGCMLESRRGIAISLAMACGTGAFDFIDLDSHLLLNEPGQNDLFESEGPILRIQPR